MCRSPCSERKVAKRQLWLHGLIGNRQMEGFLMSLSQIFLIGPPQFGLIDGFANGLISLANYLGQKHPMVGVELIDLSIASAEEVNNRASQIMRNARAGNVAVGITTTTASYQGALTVARAFKRQSRQPLIILGGHHATAQGEVILSQHGELVDVVVHGEGEVALLELARRYPNLAAVPSISYLDNQGVIRRNPAASLLQAPDLDKIDTRLSKNVEYLRSPPGKFDRTTYVSARGCPLKCAFCSVANESIRAKSVPRVVEDIKELVLDGHRSISIEDNFFAHSRRRTLEICEGLEELRKQYDFTWDCQTRVESMARNGILDAMERAGCTAVYLGVEGLTPRILEYLGKTKLPKLYLDTLHKRVVPALLKSKVSCYINIQLAVPVETETDKAQLLSHLRSLGELAVSHGREITVFPQLHVVYPGTAHFNNALETGRFGGPESGKYIFEDFTLWEAAQQPILGWLGEHFAHGVGGIPEGILSPEKLSRGQFEVDVERVRHVDSLLREIDRIPGIDLFKYGVYLAKQPTLALVAS